MNHLINLDSVGALIDPQTKMIYTQNVDGSPDFDSATDGEKEFIDIEWIKGLSKEDAKIVSDTLNWPNQTEQDNENNA